MYAIITNNGFMITGNHLQHSPKGTTWKDHKYIKKVNGRYVYESTYGKRGTASSVKAGPGLSIQDRVKKTTKAAKESVTEAKAEYERQQRLKQTEENLKNAQKIGEKALMSILGYDYLQDVKGPWKFEGENKIHYGESGFYRNRKKGKVTNVQR